MDLEGLKARIVDALIEHADGLGSFVFSMTYIDGEELRTFASVVAPVPPRDHEEALLRDKCAADAAHLVNRITENIYHGR